jgi:hypothetical protein
MGAGSRAEPPPAELVKASDRGDIPTQRTRQATVDKPMNKVDLDRRVRVPPCGHAMTVHRVIKPWSPEAVTCLGAPQILAGTGKTIPLRGWNKGQNKDK